MELKKLVELKKEMKKKKPYFIRQSIYKKKCLKWAWRRPRGLHSKLRNAYAGHNPRVKIGYSSPAEIRTMLPSGFFPVIVCCASDLSKIGKSQGALISSAVGMKKKIEILEEAKKKNIVVLNIKEIDKFVNDAKQEFEKRKQEKKEKLSKKEQAKKAKKVEKKTEKKEAAEEKTPEQQKAEEKKEVDKILTQKA